MATDLHTKVAGPDGLASHAETPGGAPDPLPGPSPSSFVWGRPHPRSLWILTCEAASVSAGAGKNPGLLFD